MNAQDRLRKDGFEGVEPVLFYGKNHPDWVLFSNFSRVPLELPHPFTGHMTHYPTGEHRYQAMKATTLEEHNQVLYIFENGEPVGYTTAGQSKKLGRDVKLRDYWGSSYGDYCYLVMLETVLAKASQNSLVREKLLETGDRPMYEDSPTDDIWGWRYRESHTGKNLLGRAWMQVRDLLL